jgi:hypothetical protein
VERAGDRHHLVGEIPAGREKGREKIIGEAGRGKTPLGFFVYKKAPAQKRRGFGCCYCSVLLSSGWQFGLRVEQVQLLVLMATFTSVPFFALLPGSAGRHLVILVLQVQ